MTLSQWVRDENTEGNQTCRNTKSHRNHPQVITPFKKHCAPNDHYYRRCPSTKQPQCIRWNTNTNKIQARNSRCASGRSKWGVWSRWWFATVPFPIQAVFISCQDQDGHEPDTFSSWECLSLRYEDKESLVLPCGMVLSHVMALTHVMVLTLVIVLACIMVFFCVIVLWCRLALWC